MPSQIYVAASSTFSTPVVFLTALLLVLSGLRINFNGTKANTISEALATSCYYSSTTYKSSNSVVSSKRTETACKFNFCYDNRGSTSSRPWALTLRGGGVGTTDTVNRSLVAKIGRGITTTSALLSSLDAVADSGSSSGHWDDEQEGSPDGEQSLSNSFYGVTKELATSIAIENVKEEATNAKSGVVNSSRKRIGGSSIIEPISLKDPIIQCTYIAETNLPTDVGHFRLRAYRVIDDADFVKSGKNKFVGTEPCVIYSSEKPPFGSHGDQASFLNDPVPVRIHDQCVTSEVFRSKRCDCSDQLKMALKYIQKYGGAIIYLQQEGRGIGLANKIAAYELQDHGMDTVEANIHLGFPEDCRQYGVVPAILKDMGIQKVRLMTNNPRKVDRLKDLGVIVADTIPMVVQRPNLYNYKYLQTKKDRMNHSNFGDMLSLPRPRDSDTVVEDTLNGLKYPRIQKNIAEDYINEGEEMAAAAVAAALDDDSQAGVIASDDGYCFGRQSVEDAIAAVGRGEIVVVVDDMKRENEGDFIMAADLATPETIATIVRYSSGVICVAMEGNRMDELNLPAMVKANEDPKGTAFSVSVDASKQHGVSTGISARDRATTLRLLADSSSRASDFVRPGHIFPLRAREGGVLTRDGHTEAAIDLARLCGRSPCGVLCEIVSEENPIEMARLPELKKFCKKNGYVLTSIVDIAQFRRDTEQTKLR